MRKVLLLLVFSVSYFISQGQGERNHWYFGYTAGFELKGSTITVLTDSKMTQAEGCVSVSNPNGKLLFYSNGISVWNGKHNVMPNGTGLRGHSSSTQSCVAVRNPGDTNKYYLFTVDAQGYTNGLRWSEIDMRLDSGRGDIITSTKNTLLHTPMSEKLVVVPHTNCSDYWLVAHRYYTDTFYAYLVTSTGVAATPVKSEAGTTHSAGYGLGYLKASPDGTRLASALWSGINAWEVFDFDASTGVVSNAIKLTYSGMTANYGVEFSPNGEVLYGSSSSSKSIIQFDLSAGSTAAAINATATSVGTTGGTSYGTGALQLAQDGKIYISKSGSTELAGIWYPDSVGTSCKFVDTAVKLGKTTVWGLPNFVVNGKPATDVWHENTCWGDLTQFHIEGDTTGIDSVRWYFDDTASGFKNTSTKLEPAHFFETPGRHNVIFIRYDSSCTDTAQELVIIQDSMAIFAMPDTLICDTSSIMLYTTGSVGTPAPYGTYCGAQGLTGTGTAVSHTIGTSTTGSSVVTPFNGYFSDQKMQLLYKASEFGSLDSGIIEEIEFFISTKLSYAAYKNFTVSIGCTSATALSTSAGFRSGLDVVYGPKSYTTSSGWNSIVLDKTFSWDGVSNIIIEICYDNASATYFDAARYSATSFGSVIYTAGTTGAGCGFTSAVTGSTYRPNLRLSWRSFPTTGDWIYSWSPGIYLSDSSIKTPTAGPSATSRWYHITISAGDCSATDSVFVSVTPCTTLPLELLEFTAQKEGSTALLKWITAQEKGVSHFAVERSLNGVDFEPIGSVKATNTPETHQYSFVDELPYNGVNYYRLRMEDYDGSYEYSQVRMVEFNLSESNIRVYPNPVNQGQEIFIDMAGLGITDRSQLNIELVNSIGQVVQTANEVYQDNYPVVRLSTGELAKGIYFVRLSTDNAQFVRSLTID